MKNRRRFFATLAAAVLTTALMPAAIANAAISGTAGPILQIAPPASAATGLASNANMWAWNEQQGVTLASAVRVDITSPGVYTQEAQLLSGVTIPAGTQVDSHYISSDGANGTTNLDGTLTFPTDILGVIVKQANLNNSEVLGSPGTDYPGTTQNLFGLELLPAGPDSVTLPDQRTITLHSNRGANGVDEVRVITEHDGSPTANAGGPYMGAEGSAVTLHGTAFDAENDFLTYAWAFTVTNAKPGTACTPAAVNTLTPTVTCTDDAVLTAQLSVKDPYNPPIVSTAQVTVNNVAPTLNPLTVPTGQVSMSSPINLSTSFSDAGTHDTHTVDINWGDTHHDTPALTETNGAGTINISHLYGTVGAYQVTVTLTDDDGGVSTRTATINGNAPPTVTSGGPYTGTEGADKMLGGSASDPENDTVYPMWTITPSSQDPGTNCTSTDTDTFTPTVNCDDDAVLNAHISATDTFNTAVTDDTTITINNVNPVFDSASASPALVPTGGTIHVNASFHDAGTHDTHTATINWGDMATSNGTIVESHGAGTIGDDAHTYTHSGFYTITVTLHDDNGGIAIKTFPVTVNTPPTVTAGGPYVGLEGTQMQLSADAHDVDGDALTYSWSYTVTGTKPGTDCHTVGSSTASTLSIFCDDDAVINATVAVSDGVNTPPVHSDTTLTVGNQNPLAGGVTQQPTAPAGNTVAISVPFSDPGTHDTHTATIDWGDGHTSPGTVDEIAGTVTGAHNYAIDNHYTVAVTINDDDDGFVTTSGTVLSDTTAPIITSSVSPAPNGAGWNHSPTTVSWTANDPLAPITSTTGCDPTTRSIDTPVAGVIYTCTATSAGGTASRSVTVKLDQVAPTLTGAATTPPNANGWYNSPVTIHWTCSDGLSGIAGSCPVNAVLSSEGSAVQAMASVHDVADNTTNSLSTPVKIDLTDPATTASTLPEWNNQTVTLALNATDNLSDVDMTYYIVDGGSQQTGTSVLLTDEGTHTVEFWSVDKAGNVESSHIATVKIDKTAPSITVSQSPAANGAGWNNTNVDVSFTCHDAESGVASCTPTQHVTTEGAGQSVTGVAFNNAGDSSSAATTLNIDKTPPTISGAVPAANANGWYNSPVTVMWSCADSLSGVATCQSPTTLSSDGASQSSSGNATDIAGNGATAHVTGINIDLSPPTITASVSPAANLAGWNNSAVTVHFTCSDATSGIAPGACPADQTVSTDGTATVAGSVADRAGNTATTSVVVKLDTSRPVITGAHTPAPNGAGWNNTDVTVSFTCTDTGSGIATAGCTGPITATEGANQSFTGTAQDVAGNTAQTTVSGINVDKTPPTITGAPTTAPNANGWYNAPVTIHWTCNDALSGVTTCPADSVLTSEGSAVTASATAFDVAGNPTTATSAPVKIDRTAPNTTASSAPNWANASVTLNLSAFDALSGVAATHFKVDGGATQTDTSVVLTTEGVHTVLFWSVDRAGNIESDHTATVKIDTTAPSISVAQSPAPNGSGWNDTDVTVSFTCTDNLAGVASCTSPQNVTSEGAGQAVTGFAVDNAGNSASASTTLNIDKTPPTISGAAPAANGNGWHNTPVTVTWNCADALSGVATCPSPTTLSTDGASQSASGTATDFAGNNASAHVTGVNIDRTPPTITPTASPSPVFGWYQTGPVTVHWTCTDNLSGVSSCPGDDVVTAEGFTTLAQTITDQAGNTSTADITIRIDKTPPTIIGTATPAPNANGWNNTDVAVSFACGDTLSGVATCSSPTTLHEGASQSVTGHAQDVAGNAASATVSGINVDKTAPTLTSVATTPPNGAGWYNHAVTIHWTCGDALSGVNTATCPPDGSITTEGSAQQLTGTVFDLAGNAKTASSAPVKIDLTAPVTSASAVPTSYSNNDVSVTLTPIDNLSGVAQTYSVVDGGATHTGTMVSFSTDGTHTLSYWSTDNAGNIETAHNVTVRIDKSAPTITASQAPAANGAGWNHTNVTVTFTCSDDVSGIASCTAPQNVATEGASQLVSGTAVDNAGNTALASASVSVDKTPPTITGTLSTTPNSFGWLNTPVAVSFSCSDALSGLASCSNPQTFGEGANQSATGTATDVAGNTATTTVSPIKVDLTKPSITATPDRAPDSGGMYTGPVTIHFTCTDALSGIAPGACPADVVVSADGVTTVSGSTTDRAGNTSATSATITITVQSVRTQKQNVLIQIDTALQTATQHDGALLKVARDALAASIDPSLWGSREPSAAAPRCEGVREGEAGSRQADATPRRFEHVDSGGDAAELDCDADQRRSHPGDDATQRRDSCQRQRICDRAGAVVPRARRRRSCGRQQQRRDPELQERLEAGDARGREGAGRRRRSRRPIVSEWAVADPAAHSLITSFGSPFGKQRYARFA